MADDDLDVTVVAKTASGKRDRSFLGKVSLTSTDEDARLPRAYRFKESDGGKHVFRHAQLATPGESTIKASSGSQKGRHRIEISELTCSGENYDVNGSVFDGCEVAQPNPGHTSQFTARHLANTDDCSEGLTTTGQILSDARRHTNPGVLDFDPLVGSAPAWVRMHVDDTNGCAEFYDVNILTTGGAVANCYAFTIMWDADEDSQTGSETIPLSGTGSGGVENTWDVTGTLDDSATFYFKMEKTCSTATTEAVSYTINYEF